MSIKDNLAVLGAIMRIPCECAPRVVWKFLWNFGMRNMLNISRFEKRLKHGKPFFPAFVMISVTESCNLSCSGCWVSYGGRKQLTPQQLDGIISACKRKGSYFFGILGGEPLMFNGLIDILARHKDCYFQLFTNGTMLNDAMAMKIRRLGNITPFFSIEGLEKESDLRRGKDDVFRRTMEGVRSCRRAKLIIGAAASIGKSNYEELVNQDYIRRLAKEGVHYLWYYIYRPVGSNPKPENALDKEQIIALRRFIVEQRRKAPLQIIDTYWDERGRAICPGATGLSHHISPSGALEFCPPLQMAHEFVNAEGSDVVSLFEQSAFLDGLRRLAADASRGCILLENPALLVQYLENKDVIDTTTRQSVMVELRRMQTLPGHDLRDEEIPERNFMYKWLKKKYFFGFGVYG
ncbi:MAG: radical SAM protein [Tannerella sp.]|jgi:MoaA/NifB/PqqE/SkfB family radical SAM enzyme|nr:radical SAM protein [Tannerella sp.]